MFPTADAEDISQVTSLSRNPSPSRDVPNSPENNTPVAKPNNNRDLTLNMLIKEMVFCVALALTTYGALHNTPTKISKHPQAVRFFNQHSVVTDWYRGQLSNALASINAADISFVMYYAPWDAESQYVRDEFEKAATVVGDRVHFSAINCWNPGSECRLQHNKIPSWPILMVYTLYSRGILYKGPKDAHSMVKFLELIIKPLERVSSTEDLISLLSTCDAVAVGFTPMHETSKYYSIWYNVAVKVREFDVIGEICLAVVTSEELAQDLGVESLPGAKLMLWNETKVYAISGDLKAWNETYLVSWVLDLFIQPASRIMPLWKKSYTFQRYADGSPILILFTPLNPLYDLHPAYALLREVAMEYYNCENESKQWINELIKLQHIQRLLYQQKDFNKFCDNYKFKKTVRKSSHLYKKEVVSQNNKYPWSNTTQRNQNNGLFNFLVKRGLALSKAIKGSPDHVDLLSLGLLQGCGTKVLPAEKSFYDNYEQCQSQNDKFVLQPEYVYLGDSETSMVPSEDDPLSPENLIQDQVKHFCKLTKFANEWGPTLSLLTTDDKNASHIHGLSCANNFSLNILAIDSIKNHHFAEALGIDIRNKNGMTAVVILDKKHESQYFLSEEYSAKSLRNFIYNFTHKNLKRSLRTHVDDAAHTHYFGSDGPTQQMEINDSSIQIIDLSTRTFRRVVKSPDTVTIVAVCGGVCPAHTTRSLTEATRFLNACDVRVQAARLDGLRHDLPWHYTVTAYPAVLVFFAPQGGEADSRAYPAGARVSPGGIAALVLRALGTPHHLRVRLALCSTAQANTEKNICLKDLKDHVTSLIDKNLGYWRRTEDKKLKDAFLKRLQYLHRVSLELSLLHVADLRHNRKYNTLINSLSTLSKNWDIDISLLKRNVTVPIRS